MARSKTSALKGILLFGLLLAAACQVVQPTDPTPTGQAELVKVLVIFKEGTDIRLRDGELVSLSRGVIPALSALLKQYPQIKIERTFSQSEAEIEAERQQLMEEGKTDVPDLNLHYILTVPDQDAALKLIQALNQLEIVESAELAPQSAPPPAENPY